MTRIPNLADSRGSSYVYRRVEAKVHAIQIT